MGVSEVSRWVCLCCELPLKAWRWVGREPRPSKPAARASLLRHRSEGPTQSVRAREGGWVQSPLDVRTESANAHERFNEASRTAPS